MYDKRRRRDGEAKPCEPARIVPSPLLDRERRAPAAAITDDVSPTATVDLAHPDNAEAFGLS